MSNTIVNTNVSALNAHRQILSVGGRQSRSAERLASGMRINRAADDAAGLAISEGMRNQIRGLDQATRNSQDGISLVQTAEGALEEVHRMGERIRQLTVQAANDTNDANDRALIDLEIQQLLDDIDRIISDTEFNGMNLLGGEAGSLGEGIRLTAQINFEVDRDNFVIAQDQFQRATDIAQNEFDSQIAVATATRDASVAEADATLALSVAAATASFQASVDAANSIFSASVLDATSAFANSTADPNVAAANLNLAIAQAEAVLASATGAATTTFNTALADANSVHGASVLDASSVFGAARTGANQSLLVANMEAGNEFRTQSNTFDSARAGHALAVDGLSSASANTFGIQSGANSLQRINIQLNNIQVYSDSLRNNVWHAIQDGEDISASLDYMDNFITSISEQRANLGAYQNRLEHTINSLRVTSENLSAANSRIRDTDMAAEMMAFTQANVLQQAGMSMLAQANMAPQNVLQLVG